jgi:hypothetical protein
MALYLEVSTGDLTNTRYLLSEGLTIGRSGCDINFPDNKISSRHALIEKDTSNQLVMVDLNSSNGLYLNGKKAKRILLAVGVKIQIGKTFFKIVEPVSKDFSPILQAPWKSVLADEVPQLTMVDVPEPFAVRPFSSLVKLTFISGLREGEVEYLGFGPRVFGGTALGLDIGEVTDDRPFFQIVPTDTGAQFENLNAYYVQFNSKLLSTEKLKTGDQIKVGVSLISVEILNG